MSRKTKIIIVLALAVVAFVAWKKGFFKRVTKAVGVNDNEAGYTEELSVTTSDADEFAKTVKAHDSRMKVIAGKIGLSDAEKKRFLELTHSLYIWLHDDDDSHWNLDDFVKTARNKGYSIDNYYAITALWALSPEGWSHKSDDINQARYRILVEKVNNLS